MAVATHVSRVAKDYAPYGYSIMESISRNWETPADGAGPGLYAGGIVLIVDDADIYLEKIQIVGDSALAAGAAQSLTIAVSSMDSGAVAETTHATIDTTASGTGGLADSVFYNVPITTPVVPKGRVLTMLLTKSAHTGTASEISLDVQVRYRRKA
jgi:hypothetical protein